MLNTTKVQPLPVSLSNTGDAAHSELADKSETPNLVQSIASIPTATGASEHGERGAELALRQVMERIIENEKTAHPGSAGSIQVESIFRELADANCIHRADVANPERVYVFRTEPSGEQYALLNESQTALVPFDDMPAGLYAARVCNCAGLICRLVDSDGKQHLLVSHLHAWTAGNVVTHVLGQLEDRDLKPLEIVFRPRIDTYFSSEGVDIERAVLEYADAHGASIDYRIRPHDHRINIYADSNGWVIRSREDPSDVEVAAWNATHTPGDYVRRVPEGQLEDRYPEVSLSTRAELRTFLGKVCDATNLHIAAHGDPYRDTYPTLLSVLLPKDTILDIAPVQVYKMPEPAPELLEFLREAAAKTGLPMLHIAGAVELLSIGNGDGTPMQPSAVARTLFEHDAPVYGDLANAQAVIHTLRDVWSRHEGVRIPFEECRPIVATELRFRNGERGIEHLLVDFEMNEQGERRLVMTPWNEAAEACLLCPPSRTGGGSYRPEGLFLRIGDYQKRAAEIAEFVHMHGTD